jgi:hypothetical protein
MKKLLIAVCILAVLLISGCKTEPESEGGVIAANIAARPHKEPGVTYELTEIDMHQYADLTAKDVSILGVKLGNSYNTVILKLSQPDLISSYQDGRVKNLEYKTSIGTKDIGLIMHFENETLTRMTVMQPFNKYLVGETVMNHTKREVYDLFGIPERFRDEAYFRIFAYDSKGIDAFVKKEQLYGISFYLPQSKF